jgi:hypothetical protein
VNLIGLSSLENMSQYERRQRRVSQRRRSTDKSSIRYVTGETRDVYDPEAKEMLRRTCHAFEMVSEPLDAERMASQMHGRMWELRSRATTTRQPNWSFGLGAPFAREVARIGEIGAKGVLLALGFQAPRRLAELCTELALELDVPAPLWADELPTAELTRSAGCVPDGVECLLLEFRRGHHQPFTILVTVSEEGGFAKHYGLLWPFDRIVESGDPDGEFRLAGGKFTPLDGAEACRRVQAAIDEADRVDQRLLDLASAKELRALTIGRIRPYAAPPTP